MRRRDFIAGVGAAAVWPLAGRAQAYPSRPMRIIVGFPPGGSTDIAVRLIGQWLSERLGQPILIENRPGANTNIAAEAAVRAAADGYTLLAVTGSNALNATLYDKLKFNFIRDISMVAGISRSPLVLEVNPTIPVLTLPGFISYAKANPGKISIASFGIGSSSHVTGELFKTVAGVDIVHVPYRGSAPMLTDLLGGQVQAAFDVLASSSEYITAGKLRALAVTTARRLDTLPNIPTVGEFMLGFEASAWAAIGVPKNTPTEVVDKLNEEINTGLADPEIKRRLASLGSTPLMGSPVEIDRFLAEETEKWSKVIRASNIKAD
jgi:tripartite-type tricarboxylate transporter receptor subunit TctC